MPDYCAKWQLVGLAIGLAPLVLALAAAAGAARVPRRLLPGLLLGAAAGLAVLLPGVPASLVLWNGLRPSICDRNA